MELLETFWLAVPREKSGCGDRKEAKGRQLRRPEGRACRMAEANGDVESLGHDVGYSGGTEDLEPKARVRAKKRCEVRCQHRRQILIRRGQAQRSR